MTPSITLDAYRYATQSYEDEPAHWRKMERKHGAQAWMIAAEVALMLVTAYGKTECAARIIDRINGAMRERGIVQ